MTMRRRRATLITLILLTGLVGAGVLWLRAQQHQYVLNRQLIAALVRGDDKKALALVEAGADPDTRFEPTPVPSLPELVRQLFHRSPPSANDSPTALLLACGARWNDDMITEDAQANGPDASQLVQAMLLRGAKVNANDEQRWTPLLWAVRWNRRNTAGVLLQYGADLTAKDKAGNTPLIYAADSPDVIRLLLEHGADANATVAENGFTPLMFEARYPSTIQLLLDHGANVNTTLDNGWTPLIIATMSRPSACMETVRLLLDHGANVNAQDKDGQTPLIAAFDSSDVVCLLLEHKAKVNAKDKHGWTALYWAATSGCEATVRLLLEHGADANAKANNGQTALYWVLRHLTLPTKVRRYAPGIDKDVIWQLLAHGADPNLADKDGITPISLARTQQQPDIVALLRQAGARK